MDSDDDFDIYLEDDYINEDVCKQMDEDLDLAVALMYQTQYDEESRTNQIKESFVFDGKKAKPLSIVDIQWETLDPCPDIHALFKQFNKDYFWGALDMVEVRWSVRMTLCAGVCSYEGRGGLCSVRLSRPLLQLRPRRDLVETLLHEMIHAYLFVTCNNKDHDAHGPEFLKHMGRINMQTGTKISVYHSFHDEVDHYRKHWWKCDGPCQHRKPYYGIVKRVANRAPCPRDPWWADHQSKCGGTFKKFKEPENFGQSKKRKVSSDGDRHKDIRSYLTPPKQPKVDSNNSKIGTTRNLFGGENATPNTQTIYSASDSLTSIIPTNQFKSNAHTISTNNKPSEPIIPFTGQGFKLGTNSSKNGVSRLLSLDNSQKSNGGKFPNENSWNTPLANFNSESRASFNGNGFRTGTNPVLNNFTSGRMSTTSTSSASTGARSKTIVINKTKSSNKPKDTLGEPENVKKISPFTGTGHVLANKSTDDFERTKSSKIWTKQKSMDNYFPKDKCGKQFKVAVIFNSDSEDEIVEIPSQKKTPIREVETVELSPMKPSQKNVEQNGACGTFSESFVYCPVCNGKIETSKINTHLDNCLNS